MAVRPDVNAVIDARVTGGAVNVTPLALGNLPAGDSSKIGRGFSTIGLDWRADCVEFDENTAKPPVDSVATNFEIQVVNTVDQFLSFTGLSAAASMSYGIYAGDASAQYLRRVISNAYSNYIAGKVTVYTEAAQIAASGLNSLGRKALRAGQDNFHRTCGNVFATSVVYGGEFIFVLEVKSRDDSEYEAIKADLSASIGTFGSVAAEFSQSIEKISQKYSLNATVLRNGLRESVPDLSAKTLQAYAQDFPRRLTENDGIGMRAIRYGVRAYSSIETQAPRFTESEIFLRKVIDQYVAAQRAAGEIEYWLAHPEEFVSTKHAAQVSANAAPAKQLLEQLANVAIRCAENPGKTWRLPTDLVRLDDVHVPQRLRWVKLPVNGPQRTVIGTVPQDETRRVRFKGIWSPSGGTNWWIPADGSWVVHFIPAQGDERVFTVPTNEAAQSGERVEAHLVDNPYTDNHEHPSNPVVATLY
jgi:hypothetical protein